MREEEEAEEEEATQPAFDPEPLHVRQLAQVQRRKLAAEFLDLKDRMRLLQDDQDSPTGGDEVKRLQYRRRILEKRSERLRDLGPKHAELPLQFINAARDGDTGYVRFCVEAQVDVNTRDRANMTSLIVATISNKVSVVKLLLHLMADPCMQDVNGATCTHYAVQLNHLHALALMIDTPPKHWDALTIKDLRQRTAIDYARNSSREDVLRLLRNRMGGPLGLAWQITKGRAADFMGIPRQRDAWNNLWSCSSIVKHCATQSPDMS